MDPTQPPSADPPIAERHGGTLTTARSALQALALLQEHPEGVRAEDVASTIGKSLSTAYYLLKALCEEGFAVHDDRGGTYRAQPRTAVAGGEGAAGPGRELSLAALADELFARTHKRSYVGVLDGGALEIVEVRGRQGLPRQPGLGDRISDAAHATAMGKVVLSLMRPVAVDRYVTRGLRRLAPATILDPDVLRTQLEQARRVGYATEVEELSEDFCCIAAPVFGRTGALRAVLGISMSARAFQDSLDVLSRAVREVAATTLAVATPPSAVEVVAPGARGGAAVPRTLEKAAIS